MNVKRVPAGLVAAGAVTVILAGCGPQFQYGAQAFGTRAVVGNTVLSGPTFLTQLGCTTQAPKATANNGAGANLSALGKVGSIKGGTANTGGEAPSSAGTENVAHVDLLAGMLTADAIRTTSITSHDANGFHTFGQMKVVGLKVAGHEYNGIIPANKTLTIPNIGKVTLNEQVKTGSSNSSSLKVTALHIRTNSANVAHMLPLSADVLVAQAESGLTGPVAARLGGAAYATNLKVGGIVASGGSAPAYVPCGGTHGKLSSNSTGEANVPDVATLGAASDKARGTLNSTSGVSETSSKIAGLNLLSDVVSANAIYAHARAAVVNGTHTATTAGSQFVGLSVKGFPAINDSVPANTKLNIPGIGTLYLHRVLKVGNGVEVRMVELILSKEEGGLPIGTDIKIGVASANTV